jgi:tetratricopeptide (TPR) repeat protein
VTPRKLAKNLPPAIAKIVDTIIVDKAKALFAEGNQHYNIGEFTQALDKYKLAYRVKPLPAFQFNIAQCHRKLGQHKEAIAMYQAYLVDVPDAQNRAMVESLIGESKQAIDTQVASEQERERERLATERQKADSVRKIKEADAAAKAEAARAEQARIEAERERERKYNRHPARKFAVAATVFGLAAGGAGTYFALQARDQQRGFDNAGCGDPMRPLDAATLATCTQQREDGDRSALYANIGIATGGAFVLTGLILLIADPGNIERPRAGASVAITPTSIGAVIRW